MTEDKYMKILLDARAKDPDNKFLSGYLNIIGNQSKEEFKEFHSFLSTCFKKRHNPIHQVKLKNSVRQ